MSQCYRKLTGFYIVVCSLGGGATPSVTAKQTVDPKSSVPPVATPLVPRVLPAPYSSPPNGSIPSPPPETAASAGQPGIVSIPASRAFQPRDNTIYTSSALLDSTNPGDEIFRDELQRHKNELSTAQQTAFLDASAVELLGMVQDLNQQHHTDSLVRDPIIKAQRFLQATDGYLKVLAVPAQYSQVAQVVIGGLKVFIDVYCCLSVR